MRIVRENDFDIIFQEGSSKDSVIVLHGYGASFQDLAPLHSHLDPEKKLNWYFVDGPLKVDVGMGMTGSAWFPIDMMGLQQSMMNGEIETFFAGRIPDGMPEMTSKLLTLLTSIKDKSDKVFLGGFSQGSMMSISMTLENSKLVDKLFLLSSTLFDESHLDIEKIKEIPVFQSHGTHDPVLPYFLAQRLKSHIEVINEYEFHSFQGGHEIPMNVISSLRAFLERRND